MVFFEVKGHRDLYLCLVCPFSSNMLFTCTKGCSLRAKGRGMQLDWERQGEWDTSHMSK